MVPCQVRREYVRCVAFVAIVSACQSSAYIFALISHHYKSATYVNQARNDGETCLKRPGPGRARSMIRRAREASICPASQLSPNLVPAFSQHARSCYPSCYPCWRYPRMLVAIALTMAMPCPDDNQRRVALPWSSVILCRASLDYALPTGLPVTN